MKIEQLLREDQTRSIPNLLDLGFHGRRFPAPDAIIVGHWRTGRNLVSYMRETCLA